MGGLANVLIKDYISSDIKNRNVKQLQQTKEMMEMIIDGVESISLYTASSAMELLELQEILKKDHPDIEDSKKLSSFKTFMDSIALSHPYIESIYLYLNNERDRFLVSTTGGLMESQSFYDSEWLESYKESDPTIMLMTERRSFLKYALPNFKTDVLTIYKKMFINKPGDGVIVVNLYNNFLEKQLDNNPSIHNQMMIIVDQNHQLLVANQPTDFLMDQIQTLVSQTNDYFSLEIHGESWIVSKVEAGRHDWIYISLTPQSALYKVPMYLQKTTGILLIISIFISILMAYIFTKRNVGQLDNITKIIKNAEKGKLTTLLPTKNQNIYNYIIERILTNFIDKHFLRVQLSERKYRAKAMELWALQSQLNPHFLFNTLETINWISFRLTGGHNEVNAMVENLADTLRYALEIDSTFVVIERDLKETMSYIAIQKIRYHEQFDLIVDCEEEVKKYTILKLILQPLLENSLTHGIRGNEGKMMIKIRIRLKGSKIQVAIIDSGTGISPSRLQELRMHLEENEDNSDHIGLLNTHKRLQLAYGEQSGITIRSKLGMGTAIYFSIPASLEPIRIK